MTTKSARAATPRSDDYQVSLRVRHPDIDPQLITQRLGLEPDHAWARGDARKSGSGQALGGMRRDSYWSATLPQPGVFQQLQHPATDRAADVGDPVALAALGATDLAAFLTLHLLHLKRQRDFILKLASEGDVALVVAMTPEPGTTVRFDQALMRQLTDLGLRLEFEFE